MSGAINLQEKYQVLPSMPPDQFEALKADIAERGVLTPIDVDELGFILDGHHRHRACVELGITDFPTIVRTSLSEEDKRMFARKSNMLRRHLSREQMRHIIAGQLKDTPTWANNRIAKELGTDSKTVLVVRQALEATSEIPKFDRLIGSDGKERPVRQKRSPAIMANGIEELQKILKRLGEGGSTEGLDGFGLGASVITLEAPDYYAGLSDEAIAEWDAYADFLQSSLGWNGEAVGPHLSWLRRQEYDTPSEWIADTGYRRKLGMREPSKQFVEGWATFSAARRKGDDVVAAKDGG